MPRRAPCGSATEDYAPELPNNHPAALWTPIRGKPSTCLASLVLLPIRHRGGATVSPVINLLIACIWLTPMSTYQPTFRMRTIWRNCSNCFCRVVRPCAVGPEGDPA